MSAIPEYEHLLVDVHDHVGVVTINRPHVMNALHRDASLELRDAFTILRDEPSVWVIILTGTGDRAFSAGNDLKATAASGPPESDPGERLPFGGITWGFTCDKPIIAAVNGVALGGGFELVLACDLAVASSNARFGLPEPKVGFIAAGGGMQRLPQHVGMKQAMGLLLTGRVLSAEEALTMGLVNEVVEPGQALAAAEAWAQEICACSPVSVRLTKACVRAAEPDLDTAVRADGTSGRLQELWSSHDFTEGVTAFNEKRPPRWTGR